MKKFISNILTEERKFSCSIISFVNDIFICFHFSVSPLSASDGPQRALGGTAPPTPLSGETEKSRCGLRQGCTLSSYAQGAQTDRSCGLCCTCTCTHC
jgi:hypothetical protein